jgi:hypothetical protein
MNALDAWPDTSGHRRSAREDRFDRANRSSSLCGALPGAQVSTLQWNGLPAGHEDRADIARGGRCASAVHYQGNLPVVWARGTVCVRAMPSDCLAGD